MLRPALIALCTVVLLLPTAALAQSSYSTGFEPPAFVPGDVNGQSGWGHISNSPTGGTIVPAPPGPPSGFQTQSLELFTRAAANFGVANHLSSATVTDPAGESTSTIQGVPVAGAESTFQASFWFRTPTAPLISSRADGRFAELNPSARANATSPANRYAQVRLVNSTNTAAGVVRVEMGWYTTYPTFIVAPVANLAWGQWYRFEYRIEFVDGLNGTASNDRFSLTVYDAAGARLGTGCGSTWETGYRFGNFDAFNTPRGVNGFDFWSTSGPNLTVAGHIDGLSISTSTPAVVPLAVTVTGAANVCAGGTTTLTANATGGTGTYTTYTWRDASNTVVGSAPTLTAGAGTYTVTVSDSLCSTAASQPFIVTAFAPLAVTVSGNTNVCFGATTTLTANASGGSGSITQLVWRNAANAIVGTGPTLVAGAGTYTAAATDASCGTAVSAPVTVQTTCRATPAVTWVNPLPIVYGTALDATQLNATASVPGTFVYTPAAGTVLAAGPNQVLATTFSPADSANYETVNASVLITVERRPTTTVIHSIAPSPSDAGQPVTVSFAVGNTFGSLGGTVTVTDGSISCSAPASAGSCILTFSTAGSRSISASYSGDPNHLPSASAARAHDVSQERAFALVEGFGSICAGGSVAIRVHLSGVGPWTITWSDGLVETSASALHERVVQPSATTTYSITSVRDRNGAGATAGGAVITVRSVAAPLIETVPSAELGSAAMLRASAGFVSYQWFLGGAAIPGATSRELVINPVTPANLGPYTVTGTREGCASAPSSAVTLVAEAPDSDEAIIAVVGNTRGANGAIFRTTVHLTNATAEPMAGEIRFIDPSLPVIPYTLAPGETQFIANLLPESFSGLTSANVRRTRGRLPTAVVQVFHDGGAAGNDGMIERIIPAADALRAGARAVLLSPIDPVATRFNVGLRSLLDGLVVRVQRRTVDGLLLGTFDRTLPPSTLVHESFAAFTGAQAGSSESLTFEILRGSGVIYGAATDNGTSDPNLQVAARIESRTSSGRFILPVAGSVRGAFGSRFATGVQIHNPTPSGIIVAATFHPAGRPASEGDMRRDVAISGGATLALDDVVAWLGVSGMGSVDIDTAASTRPILLSRVYSVDDDGQASATMVPVPEEQLLSSGQSGVLVAPRAHSASRFNIGVRTTASGARMTATVRNAAGSVVRTAPLQFGPNFFAQSGATELLGYAFTSDESVVIAVEEGAAAIYGVWTDNRTQDPSLQYAVRP